MVYMYACIHVYSCMLLTVFPYAHIHNIAAYLLYNLHMKLHVASYTYYTVSKLLCYVHMCAWGKCCQQHAAMYIHMYIPFMYIPFMKIFEMKYSSIVCTNS